MPKKGIPIDANMIQEKAKSLYGNLKQKEGDGPKAREFYASKEWFDKFRKRFGFKNVKITGKRGSFCRPRGSRQVPKTPLRTSLRKKDICLNRFLMQS